MVVDKYETYLQDNEVGQAGLRGKSGAVPCSEQIGRLIFAEIPEGRRWGRGTSACLRVDR